MFLDSLETANFKTYENKLTRVHALLGVICSCFSICAVLGGALGAEKLKEAVPPNFFIVMKKLFLSLVAIVCSVASYGQGSLLATLSHEGQISTFYGASALKDAHAAAANGDVITLSSGTFISTDINKGITVRGAGMGIDTTLVVEPTVIAGDFKIDIPDTVSNRLTIEGIYINNNILYTNVKNPLFLKCRLREVTYESTSSTMKDASFVHCRIAKKLELRANCSASCVNSVIMKPSNFNSNTCSFAFANCVVNMPEIIYWSSFINCLLISNNAVYLSSNSTAYNCVGFNYQQIFKNITNLTNKTSDYGAAFKTYRGSDFEQLDSETFELTDDARTKFLGMDGTEVGIYGGDLRFDPTPSNPQITKCNVASKSTADGKLSVDIEVNAAE